MKESGVKVDKESLDVLYKLMDGKDVPTLIKEGEKKMASMPCGGSDGGAPTAPEKKKELWEPTSRKSNQMLQRQ